MIFLKIEIKEDLTSYHGSEPFNCYTVVVENDVGYKDPLQW